MTLALEGLPDKGKCAEIYKTSFDLSTGPNYV